MKEEVKKTETETETLDRLKKENPPSEHLKNKFEVIGVVPGIVHWKGSKYDLRKITAETADILVKDGFKYLKKVETESKPATAVQGKTQ